jgi:hypothetical protein
VQVESGRASGKIRASGKWEGVWDDSRKWEVGGRLG